ncbi:hypothetical protein LTR36_006787, partial [Oleoguttula mirabilis]
AANVVVFDEAGQATGPDLLLALADQVATGKCKLVVLAGDTKQLGPVVPSETAKHNCLGTVLGTPALKRIKHALPYLQHMELVHSFRGHHSTFAMSSHKFYDGRMLPGGDPARWLAALAARVRTSLLNAADFRPAFDNHALGMKNDNRQLFIEVDSPAKQEENGTSWYNPRGVKALIVFLRLLLDCGGVAASDIGTISMYAGDIRCIEQQLHAHGIRDVEVAEAVLDLETATVEAFQGR